MPSPMMNVSVLPQPIGNVCAGLATLVFLIPFQRLLPKYADKHLNSDEWATPDLQVLAPLWLLLMVSLLCVSIIGGFDWLRLGRLALYVLAVAGTLALAVVSFVFIGLYFRPGFTPSVLYLPVIYLVPISTVILVVVRRKRLDCAHIQNFLNGYPRNWKPALLSPP